jgi:hypothetical protein
MAERDNNIESILIAWLSANLPSGWSVSSDIPENKPDKFVTVERTGGPVDSVRIEEPEVIISYYSNGSASEVSKVSLDMDIKLRAEIIQHDNVSRVRRMSLVRLDDLTIKFKRYQAYYSFVHLI